MDTGGSNQLIPVTRAACVSRYAKPLQDIGAPVERLLSLAGIPPELLEFPAAAVSLESAFRFGELACHAIGTEHLPIQLHFDISLHSYGPYGRFLMRSATVYEYLRKGIELNNMIITGQRFWLSRHGPEYRLNLTTHGEPGVGSYQSHLESLAVTIAVLRKAVAPYWSPREISFAWHSRENLPECRIFDGSRIVRNTGSSYITIPASLMGMRFYGDRLNQAAAPGMENMCELPESIDHLVEHQIETLLSSSELHIDTVAESLTMSRRSLQRRLAEMDLSYSRMVAETRTHLATRWLQESNRPIGDIAHMLGYTDSSNFTRAFRKCIGVSPAAFRDFSSGEHPPKRILH